MAKLRVLAELVDLAILAAWVILVLVGVGALAAWRDGLPQAAYALEWHALALVLIVVPVSIAAGLAEASRRRATPGKRVLGLRVFGKVTTGLAIARNLLKYGPPLVLGYLAVLAVVDSIGDMRADDWVLVGVTVVLFAIYVGALFIGRGTTVYDAIVGLSVRAVDGRRALPTGGASLAAPRRAL